MSFQGMSKSIDPMGGRTRRDTALEPHPAPIVSMSLRPGIPWRVALPQSPPPLPRPWTSMQYRAGKANLFPANGHLSLILWPHQTTALQDFYAAQSYSDVPAEDGRRIVIGWINNWMYAGKIPTSPWRGGRSIPREVKLRRFQEGLRLTQRPVSELESLRGEELHLVGVSVDDANREIARQKYGGDTLEIQAEIELGSADEVGFRVRQGEGEETLVGYTIDPAELFVDRTKSGEAGFDETFAGRHSARLKAQDGRINLHILVDRSVVEVFAGDGRVAITDRISPKPSSKGLSIYSKGGNARIVGLKMWKLGSVWK